MTYTNYAKALTEEEFTAMNETGACERVAEYILESLVQTYGVVYDTPAYYALSSLTWDYAHSGYIQTDEDAVKSETEAYNGLIEFMLEPTEEEQKRFSYDLIAINKKMYNEMVKENTLDVNINDLEIETYREMFTLFY